jgi:hypothetical protein
MPARRGNKASARVTDLATKVRVVAGDNIHGGKKKKATPKLLESAAKGTHLPEVVIEVW